MTTRPNILILMADQMQGRALEPGHFCQTPNLDRLAARGVRFARAHAPSATCVPSRTSLMTGLLPHNWQGTPASPHWAQNLAQSGYQTGYFGKWGLSSSDPRDHGWQVVGEKSYKAIADSREQSYSLEGILDTPPGYNRQLFYGVTDTPPQERGLGLCTQAASQFLEEKLQTDEPWCCFISLTEPHDPYICGEEAFALYDVNNIPLAPSLHDDLAGRPNVYRRVQRVWESWSERRHREAAACYWASITEVDAAFGRLLDQLEAAGKTDDTLVIVTADHGDLLGAHGLYCKNFMAAEEIYNIPLLVAGAGIGVGETTSARAGLHDLGPTLLELTNCDPLDTGADSRSFVEVLRDPQGAASRFQSGYAEYSGGMMRLTQRVLWDGEWKFVFNGFDFDELYDLENDPHEMKNLAEEPEYRARLLEMTRQFWRRVEETGDRALYNSHYPPARIAACGPSEGQDQ
jgi:arylsulfatase A-like enzyme